MAAKGDDAEEPALVQVDGREVEITSPGKVFFSERGDTKLDLVHYYLAVGDALLRATAGRPVLLQRFPDGAEGNSFFQKRVPASAPDWLATTVLATPNGTTSEALVVADLAHVAWAVNLGCLGFHVWPSLAADPGRTDELRIDLDPGPGATFPMVVEAADEVRARVRRLRDRAAARRPPATGASTSTCAWRRTGTATTSAPPRWPSPASSSGAGRTS